MISSEQRNAVIELWKKTLGLAEIDLDRGFADLGGTSLAANQFVAELSRSLGIDIPVIRIFEYPTLRLLLRFLTEGSAVGGPGKPQAASGRSRAPAGAQGSRANHDIAIIGMACRFPGAKNLNEFWQNLLDGRDAISSLSEEQLGAHVPRDLLQDPRYVRACGLIDQPYAMDAGFFDINPMEAKLTDPQQRVLLEVSWQALEHAGEAPGAIERTAVYAGTEDNSYYKAEIMPFPDAEERVGRFSVMTGNEKDYVAMRIAHKLNLKGPAVSVHTACSTSLVAIIMACKSLRLHECDMALAGGASVHFPTPEGYYYQEGGVFSSDGHCRPFDKNAQGTNFTDGAGMVVLKRVEDALRDGNTIFAVIKGGAINSDGGDKVSFSAPSINGQASCIRDALADADVDAGTIQYLEAHGTATPVGDPIEVEALRQAYATRQDPNRKQYCGLGSVKSNIGHTTAAAGVASLIKTAMALRHGVIPATVHFQSPNPAIDIENSPFYVVAEKQDWPRGEPARRAGISSFGIGGTNSHAILEEAPVAEADASDAGLEVRPFEIWPVSAKSAAQRDKLVAALTAEKHWPRDIAHTLQKGRARFAYRGARVRLTHLPVDDLLVQPAQRALNEARLAFMFPGQGSQYIEMGKSLYESIPEFRATFSRCCEVLSRELGLDFKAFIFDAANQETLENTRYTQPSLFSIEVSLGRMLLDWGIRPSFMLGHSIGEFVAAHLAGVFSLEDALKLIAARGRLMADLPRGRMLSARGALDAVTAAAGEPVDVASINGPVHCVLAGDNEQIDRVTPRLEAAGIPCKLLHTSHAFHSAMMSPVVEPFLDVVRTVTLNPPRMPIISTVTGEPMKDADAVDPRYWANHLRATVKFSPAVFKAIEEGANVFLEIGPRTTLSSLTVQHFAKVAKPGVEFVALSTLGDQPDAQTEIGGIGTALAKLWCSGIELPWEQIWTSGRKMPLESSYPFERKEYRFSEGRKPQARVAHTAMVESAPMEPVAGVAPVVAGAGPSVEQLLAVELEKVFSEYSGLAIQHADATFVECGLDSLVLMQIGVEIGKTYGVSVSLRDLMGKINTLQRLADHVAAAAAPDKVRHLRVAAPPPAAAPIQAMGNGTAVVQPVYAQQPAAYAQHSTPRVPASPTLSPPGDFAQTIHQQLTLMKSIIELQLQYLDRGAGVAESGSANLSITRVEPPRAVAANDAGGEPLIRARHCSPPRAGAFRVVGGRSDTWYLFNAESRRYEALKR